jgi:hypothetical protein
MKYHPVMAGAMLRRMTIPAVSILLLGTSKIMFILSSHTIEIFI